MYKLMGLGSGFNELVWGYSDFQKYNSANSGNLLFNFAINQLVRLEGGKYLWSTRAEEINGAKSNLLIPMANNIGPHMDILKQGPRLDGVEVNAVVIGIGAQWPLSGSQEDKVPEGTIKWLRKVASMSEVPNISVRGQVTLDFFRKIGLSDSAIALGCPSLLVNPNRKLGEILCEKAKKMSAAGPVVAGVSAGNQYLANLGKLEKWLIKIAEGPGSRYIVQHPKQLISIAEGYENDVSDEERELVRSRWFTDYSISEMEAWFKRHSTTYTSIPQWIMDCRKYDMMVGTRIHGVQMGIQAGTPSVCLYIDSRTKELCEMMRIPHYSALDFQKSPDIKILIGLIKEWDWGEFDLNRLEIARKTHDFFTANNLVVSNHLIDLVSN